MPATQRVAPAPAASRLRERVAATPIASLGAASGSAEPEAAYTLNRETRSRSSAPGRKDAAS